MTRRKILIIGSVYTLALLALVAADAGVTSSLTLLPEYAQKAPVVEGGVQKKEATDIGAILESQNLEPTKSSEKGLLTRVVPETTPVQTYVLLEEGDRFGFLAYVQAADVRMYFSSLKEALQQSFSAQMRELEDITETPEKSPVRNILSFIDPALSEEKMYFVRSRDRLIELHVVSGKEKEAKLLIEKLTE